MNGIFNHYGTTTAAPTGAANADTTLLSRTLSAGAVDDGNALRLRCEFDGTGTVSLFVNGQDLLHYARSVDGAVQVLDLVIWRVGRYGALVMVDYVDMGGVEASRWRLEGRYAHTTGFDWQAQQSIEVVGRSSTAGGLTLERAGIAK